MYEEKRAELLSKMEAAAKEHRFEDFNSLKAEVEKLDKEHDEEIKNLASLEAMRAEAKPVDIAAKSVIISGGISAGAVSMNSGVLAAEADDVYASTEYRRAFMNFVINHTSMPSKFMNASEVTTSSDTIAVIPTNIMRGIFEKLETVGKIWNRITKTSFKGGVEIPYSTVKPKAEWLAEGAKQDTQKKPVNKIVLHYYKLRCTVAVTFEASFVTLDVFESTLIQNMAEAMIKEIELAVISGSGSGEPTGILSQTPEDGQLIEIAKSDKLDYKALVAAEAALPQAYDSNAVWVMTKPTFFNYIVGMTDSNKRPIMHEVVGVNGKPGYYILGREVVIVDNDFMDSMKETLTDDTDVAFIYDFSSYVFNTNYEMRLKRYEDNETDNVMTKTLMLGDGKPADIHSLVILRKLVS